MIQAGNLEHHLSVSGGKIVRLEWIILLSSRALTCERIQPKGKEKRKLSVTKLPDISVMDRQRMVCHGPRGSLRGEPS